MTSENRCAQSLGTQQESAGSAAPRPRFDFSEFGETQSVALMRLQKLGAKAVTRSWTSIPQVTHHDEADVTELEERRRARPRAATGPKMTALALHVKVVVSALEAFPRFNATLDEEQEVLLLKKYFNIGIAIDTPQGLVVGVVRDCDRKSSTQIAASIDALATNARGKGLSYEEMSGSCFTISSLGAIGGTGFTPLIQVPEVAILGISRLIERPVRGADDSVEWRTFVPLSLTYDHRVVNGMDAARFLNHLRERLADPGLLDRQADAGPDG